MKILFVDPMGFAYNTRTPTRSPLGGTQSAVLYLSQALAALGHAVTVINGVEATEVSDAVTFTPFPYSTADMNAQDLIVVVAAPLGQRLRQLGVDRPIVLWCHHATDQRAVAPLANAEERAAYQGYAMVSQWQAESYIRAFAIPVERTVVLRNAASPYVLNQTPKEPWYISGAPPTLGYASTPFRGLDILLMGFPLLRTRIPEARLRIYSSMGIYGHSADQDGYRALYALAKSLPGVEYVGPLPQAALAEALMDIDYLAFPSTFAETSCIAVIEAMAAGAHIVSTDLGALPETTAGFATLVNRANDVPPLFAARYVDALGDVIEAPDKRSAQSRRDQQLRVARDAYSWKTRAETWTKWIGELVAA